MYTLIIVFDEISLKFPRNFSEISLKFPQFPYISGLGLGWICIHSLLCLMTFA